FGTGPSAPTATSALTLPDALPICQQQRERTRTFGQPLERGTQVQRRRAGGGFGARTHRLLGVTQVWGAHLSRKPRPGVSTPDLRDRKSTRLNSSHVKISYAVFCLK